jgi:hypothetical protein
MKVVLLSVLLPSNGNGKSKEVMVYTFCPPGQESEYLPEITRTLFGHRATYRVLWRQE